MGASKKYKRKTCAYCGRKGSSSTNDHVVARAFFLDEDQLALPQVPACLVCNNRKSALEAYAAAALMIGTKHPEAKRYQAEKVKPRLAKNAKLTRELGLDRNLPEVLRWVTINGITQPMVPIKIDASKVQQLMQLIVRGLYRHHFGSTLDDGFWPDVSMFPPEREAAMWVQVEPYFPVDAPRVSANLGRGSFIYSGVRSPAHEGLSAWQMAWHGGISLHGEGGSGASHWWAFTRPTPAKLAAASPPASGL